MERDFVFKFCFRNQQKTGREITPKLSILKETVSRKGNKIERQKRNILVLKELVTLIKCIRCKALCYRSSEKKAHVIIVISATAQRDPLLRLRIRKCIWSPSIVLISGYF